ncbi:MAG: response regulator [Prolixibacteraceae bacterium]|jgi:signal transduction histidine kinase|nr:response regulator [Prolixibacteraceae bacterium]MBT6007433.1 response regulator [Prolixibacteraceae bacterium]MBT6766151.1 response regulator [Prolixibacteraceae bacterium]MBT6998573.1 response regulator [Prolixibacteraceae bacterium]MBT7395074.1 response regulator [Prolixibacteraceae bacterium]
MKSKKSFFKLLNPLSLSFRDKTYEHDFLKYYKSNTVGHIRIAMIISVGLFLIFAWLDAYLFPEFKSYFYQIRFYFVIPVILFGIVYTLFSSSLKYLQEVTSLFTFLAGCGILAMLHFGGPDVNILYYVGLILIFIFNYDFLKLRFVAASIVGLLLLIGYILIAKEINTTPQVLIASLFFLVSANIMGMVSAYFYEYINRKYYYSNYLLGLEKKKTVEINLNLEDQVKERTSKLEKINKDLVVAKEAAEESDRLKSVFLATMSHELRTPLNAIIGFSELIQSSRDEIEENLSFASTINNSGHHLLSLVEDLFDITLIDSGEIKLKKSEFNLLYLLKNIEEIMLVERSKMGKEHIAFEFSPCLITSDCLVFTDENKLKQVLLNLLKNAFKFTVDGKISYGCSEEIKENKYYLKFFVRDTGIGIPKDKLDLIFNVFRQVDDADTRKFDGAGIGLSVAKKLVNILGGEIWVDSKLGEESVFYFTILNRRIEKKSKVDNDSYEKKKDGDEFVNTVLVVEDDEPSFYLIDILLKKWGLKTAWAKNGKDAIGLFKEKEGFDIILMDLNMPVFNGFETTKQIKQINPVQVVIAQTAYAVAGDKEKALAAGCDDYISKPINADKMKQIIYKYI